MEIHAKNEFSEILMDGEVCVEFITGGQRKLPVLVDKAAWYEYLSEYHWTINKRGNYFTVKSSKDKHSIRLHKFIIEHEYSELDYWGNTIDHINNNTLDNRLKNLAIANGKLNTTNIASKFRQENNHLIHKQKGDTYKVHTNINDETIYRGGFKTIEEARQFRDEEVLPYLLEVRNEMIKKQRDIEFERGLRDKLDNNEISEVHKILKKYKII